MEFAIAKTPKAASDADLLILTATEDEWKAEKNPMRGLWPAELKRAAASGDFSGEAGQFVLVYARRGPARCALVGLGKESGLTPNRLQHLMAEFMRARLKLDVKRAAVAVRPVRGAKLSQSDFARAALEGLRLGAYRFTRYKSKKPEKGNVGAIAALPKKPGDRALAGVVELAGARCAGSELARDLGNASPEDMNPETFEEAARDVAKRYGFKMTVIDAAGMRELGMNGILAVGRGSLIPPRLIIIEANVKAKSRPHVLIGKTMTFDSGGLNIKTSAMELMKMDMGGGAAVLGCLEGCGMLGLKTPLVAIMPAVENIPGSRAYKPGDVLVMMGKKTVEVGNTDAEGRLTLADAITYSKRYEPSSVVDIATLTGSCLRALGFHAAGLLCPEACDELAADLASCGEATGERLWRLPLWPEHKDRMKSDVADLINTSDSDPNAGMSTAGAFLWEFADGLNWAHLDIAGPIIMTKDFGILSKGASGFGARLLLEYARTR